MTKLPILESYWVEEKRFLAGEFPGSYNHETTRHRMDAFLEAGINTFIDLTQSHELVPYEPILKNRPTFMLSKQLITALQFATMVFLRAKR